MVGTGQRGFVSGIAAVLVALAAACGGDDDRPDERRLPEDFTFRWHVPTRVAVTETTNAPLGSTVLAYTAELVREDDHLRLRMLDGEVRRVGDVVVDYEERAKKQVRTAYALADVNDALIGPDGKVLGCVNSPALRARASSYFLALPKATRNAYEIQVRDAAEDALARATCVERWQSWVSAWIGFEAIPGLPDQWIADSDVPVGEEPKIRVTDEHVGWLKRGGVRVTRRQEIDGAALTADLAPLAAELTKERKTPIVADRLTIASATWLATADIDPKTLRPSKVEWVKTLRYALDGMADTRVTRRTWTFTYLEK